MDILVLTLIVAHHRRARRAPRLDGTRGPRHRRLREGGARQHPIVQQSESRVPPHGAEGGSWELKQPADIA